MRSALFIAVTVSTLAAGFAIPAQADPDLAGANAAMATVFEKSKAPGAGFAIGRDGQVVSFKGYGYADVAAHTPVGPETMFALASNSKPITAMAVMKLIDDGKLTLDTPAFAFLGLSQFADPRAAHITVKNLLNHSSGLPHDVPALSDDPMETARAAAATKLDFTPGSQQAYSNAGFNVLGAVVEKASGQSYVDFVRSAVFAPAGVTHSAVLEAKAALPGQAVRYNDSGGVVVNKSREGGTPAGGWILAPADMVRVLMAYDAGKIVTPASRAAMLAPPEAPLAPRTDGSAFGLGWDVVLRKNGARGPVLYGKNGGLNGDSTWSEHRFDGIDYAVFYNGGNGSGAHRPGLVAVEKALDGK